MADNDKLWANDRAIQQFAVNALKENALQHLNNLDVADLQNERQAWNEEVQAKRKSAADRQQADAALQHAFRGVLGAAGGPALFSSVLDNLLAMARERNDSDNVVNWQQKEDNINQIRNALIEAKNQNVLNARDIAAETFKGIKDIEANAAASKSNIFPDETPTPGQGDTQYAANQTYNELLRDPNLAQLSGYLMPENSLQNVRNARNKIGGQGYFAQQMNRINRR